MRRFEAIVMSESEPVNHGTLWLREKKNTLDPDGPKQYDIWYFGERGWQPVADFDTRFSFTKTLDYEGVTDPIDINVTKDAENGIVEVSSDYSIYSGSRALGNNANLVNETALKLHVDDLQSQISQLNVKVNTLESQVSVLQGLVASHATTISELNSRITALESS